MVAFSPVKSTDAENNFLSDFHFHHCSNYEMADEDLDYKASIVLPELMPVNCSEPAAVVKSTELPTSQSGCTSLDDSRLSRFTLVPPLVSLRHCYTSSTQQQQQQQENVSDQLPGEMLTVRVNMQLRCNLPAVAARDSRL